MNFKYLTTVVILILALFFAPQTAFAENAVDLDSGFLRLVNKSNRLDSDYRPSNMVEYAGVTVHCTVRDAFVQMLTEMKADGIHNLSIQSAYRTYEHQQDIFDQKVRELTASGHAEAEITASWSVQPPGASEHQLGLAIDVSIDGKLCQAFGETDAGKWLEMHSHKYGFIVRYPGSKTSITQIVYEPWHLRYVGTPHATIIKNLELTLEEYLSYIKHVKMYIFWENNSEYYLVQYKTAPEIVPCDMVDVSSLCPMHKDEYVITTRRTYPINW